MKILNSHDRRIFHIDDVEIYERNELVAYVAGDKVDPTGPGSGNRVLRGGCWGNPATVLRSAYRFNTVPTPTNTPQANGFRVARSAP